MKTAVVINYKKIDLYKKKLKILLRHLKNEHNKNLLY